MQAFLGIVPVQFKGLHVDIYAYDVCDGATHVYTNCCDQVYTYTDIGEHVN